MFLSNVRWSTVCVFFFFSFIELLFDAHAELSLLVIRFKEKEHNIIAKPIATLCSLSTIFSFLPSVFPPFLPSSSHSLRAGSEVTLMPRWVTSFGHPGEYALSLSQKHTKTHTLSVVLFV